MDLNAIKGTARLGERRVDHETALHDHAKHMFTLTGSYAWSIDDVPLKAPD